MTEQERHQIQKAAARCCRKSTGWFKWCAVAFAALLTAMAWWWVQDLSLLYQWQFWALAGFAHATFWRGSWYHNQAVAWRERYPEAWREDE